jgi:hypothetical protein
MDLLLGLIATYLELDLATLTKEAARDAVRKCMEPAIPGIAARMQERGWGRPHAMPQPVIRDALFRLWREVIPSGTLADAIRDQQDDQVLQQVLPKVAPRTSLMEVVAMTMTAALRVAF